MPITIHFTEDDIGVNFYAVDAVTGRDIIAAMKELFQHENFTKLRYWIIDRSLCTRYDVDAADVKQISEMDVAAAKKNPALLQAMIAETNLQFGMSRMYEIHMGKDGFETKIFRDRASAEEWIKNELGKEK